MSNPDKRLPLFRTPADQATRDLAGRPEELSALAELWSAYLDGISQQAITGNPWQATFTSNTPYYYNPLVTDIPSTALTVPIQWGAMPGRIGYYNQNDWRPSLTQVQLDQLADYGWTPSPTASGRSTFPPITTDPCSGASINQFYGPFGPRGWQDEYCEWSVSRDPTTGKILRIDFTCENPEYWYALWQIAPDVVLSLYQSTLDNAAITMADLCLTDPAGQPVIDPLTGRPAYNPLNRWNCGPVRTDLFGGAMHLTSTPNTLQTEIAGLAGAATIQRLGNYTQPAPLLCCSQYGQPFRNSDPTIGLNANLIVGKNNRVSLADPPGLYIQMPDFSQYALPPGAPTEAKPSDFWRIVRGASTLNDMFGKPLPGNLILHAVYEVPPTLGFTVGDITINGTPILYGAQVAATFFMQLNATAIPISGPLDKWPCVGTPVNPTPQPLQMLPAATFAAYFATAAPPNPVGRPMVLAANTVIVPPTVAPGSTASLTLVCAGVVLGPGGELPAVTVDGANGSVVAKVTAFADNVTYTVPGNTYPSSNQALTIEVAVASDAQPGLRGVTIENYGAAAGQAAPAFLRIAR